MPVSYPSIDPKDPLRVARFIFEGWRDAELCDRFHGSVGFLSQEAAAFRFEPSFKDTGIFFIESESDEQERVGTVPGSVLQVPFNTDYTSIERVTEWFTQAGLMVRPADPMYVDLMKEANLT